MATYNGHKNYNCWNVSLWLNNDEPLYRLMMGCIKRGGNRKGAAERLLNLLPEKTPDGVPYSVTAIIHAMVGL